jgi:hypothetical protein
MVANVKHICMCVHAYEKIMVANVKLIELAVFFYLIFVIQ